MYNLKIIRFLIGGIWFRQEMTGELPMCYGRWWTRTPLAPHRYHRTTDIEIYSTLRVITKI